MTVKGSKEFLLPWISFILIPYQEAVHQYEKVKEKGGESQENRAPAYIRNHMNHEADHSDRRGEWRYYVAELNPRKEKYALGLGPITLATELAWKELSKSRHKAVGG